MFMSLPFYFHFLSSCASEPLEYKSIIGVSPFMLPKVKLIGLNSISYLKAGPILSMISLQHIYNLMIGYLCWKSQMLCLFKDQMIVLPNLIIVITCLLLAKQNFVCIKAIWFLKRCFSFFIFAIGPHNQKCKVGQLKSFFRFTEVLLCVMDCFQRLNGECL